MHELLINILWSLGTIIFACVVLGMAEESFIGFILEDRPILHMIAMLCYWGFIGILVLTYWV